MSTDVRARHAVPAGLELWREGGDRRQCLLRADIDLGADRPLEIGPGEDDAADQALLETDRLTLVVTGPGAALERLEIQLRAGTVPVASTSPERRDERRLVPAGEGLETRDHQPFLDGAGFTSLGVFTRWPGEEAYSGVARVPLRILPAKITPEEFDRLLGELEETARGVIFDAYAKTAIGLRPGAPALLAPPEKLEHIAVVLELFGQELARISRRPAQRLTLSPRRVLIAPGEAITPETSISISEDTSLLARTAAGVLPRERVETTAERDVHLGEHAALSGFLAALAADTRELLDLIRSEVGLRLDRRRLFAAGEGGIWSEREEPRVAALRGLETRARGLLSRSRDLRRRHDFLPPEVPPLRRAPELTKRFAHVGAYAVLYRVMREYQRSRQVELDGRNVLVNAKSLPVLWEYWTALRVIDFLQRRLRYAGPPWEAAASLFQRVVGHRERFVIDLAGDRRLEFLDEGGRRVLFRYQPLYFSLSRSESRYGRLKRQAAPFEPDLAIEVFHAGDESGVPEHLILLDAKYSSRSHEDLLADLLRYRNIGDFRTGRRLARQIWALTNALKETPREPTGALWPGEGQPENLETHATADNEVFFTGAPSPALEVCGVLGLRPTGKRAGDPLDLLLARALAGLGVEMRA
jgi:hypothetical protein